MHYLYVLFILIFCVPAYFAPSHLVRPFAYFATLSLLIGVLGCAWPSVMPKDFLQNNPWAANSPLQPAISMAIGSVCLLFGIGLFLALGSRKLLKKN
ncbi:hypothetical protein TSACC_21908 [Terrimicrobium sacchariphilum]|uniref:Uncharacterized protein n=1 Tax=Terrimicrobium sacchariphilum TaxID=690879 RepID=A0A146G7L3_TERSA|nr:hypothetical protein [Terrimicrobium sacchariphilum]GAT33491.1 hypothetical protein TSACC_21908 [Terrimicrobium sacchariphilum]